jgi:hypothetical protein
MLLLQRISWGEGVDGLKIPFPLGKPIVPDSTHTSDNGHSFVGAFAMILCHMSAPCSERLIFFTVSMSWGGNKVHFKLIAALYFLELKILDCAEY